MERGGHDYAAVSENTFEERKKIQPSHAIPATRISVPAPPKGPELVNSLSLSLSQGYQWWMVKTKIPPYKHVILAYGATIVGFPSQIAYGGGVEKCHAVVFWWHYNDYLTAFLVLCGELYVSM